MFSSGMSGCEVVCYLLSYSDLVLPTVQCLNCVKTGVYERGSMGNTVAGGPWDRTSCGVQSPIIQALQLLDRNVEIKQFDIQ